MADPIKLRKLIASIESDPDWELVKELKSLRKNTRIQEEAARLSNVIKPESSDFFETVDSTFALETIVMRVGHPVLMISNHEPMFSTQEVESQVWKEKLMRSKDILLANIPSVGKIELENHPTYDWIGTAWLVAENIIVTNRHVAEIFGTGNGKGYIFRQFIDNPIRANIDFLEEQDNPASFVFKISEILHIEGDNGPDIAFLRVEPVSGTVLPSPVKLYTGTVHPKTEVGVIGYPARDSRIPDQVLMDHLFGDVYNKKSFAPGLITKSNGQLFHDCSTLGGCSGGLVLNLQSGEAVGLHFAGKFLDSNFAIPSYIVDQRLKSISTVSGQSFFTGSSNNEPKSNNNAGTTVPTTVELQTIRINIPLEIKISVGQQFASAAAPVAQPNDNSKPVATPEPEEEFYTEGRPEDYSDRKGYDSDFLNVNVPLPQPVGKTKIDVLTYLNNGDTDKVLRYEHFSVVMSKSRRLCLYSAVNIDGGDFRKANRAGWRTDPVPATAQILKECYGSPPKFSRGHMTRREDPIWGKETDALRGNADSMCVTNTVPQMQSFNSPIWLGLENYALQNARKDGMKISVFTGPILRKDDPIRFDVKIPVSFWKIIVFINDNTGKLSATGYMISQQEQLPEEEFVFGAYDTAQTPIGSIEKMTGLSFGNLRDHDPLKQQEELPSAALKSFKQIIF